MTREVKIQFLKELKDGKYLSEDFKPKRFYVYFEKPIRYQVNDTQVDDAEFSAALKIANKLRPDTGEDTLHFIYPEEIS